MNIRPLIALAALVSAAVAVPAAAEDSAPPAGRFQLAPGDDSSFVRLDTRTGAVAHCRREQNIWHCEPIADSDLAERFTVLSAKVDELSVRLDRLSLSVADLATRAEGPAATVESPAAESKPQNVARTAVNRLLEMIRAIKHGRADAT